MDVALRVPLMRELFALPVVHMVLISVSFFFFNQLCISFLKKQENSPWIRNLLQINSHLAAAGCMSVVQEFAKSLLFSLWDLWLDFT